MITRKPSQPTGVKHQPKPECQASAEVLHSPVLVDVARRLHRRPRRPVRGQELGAGGGRLLNWLDDRLAPGVNGQVYSELMATGAVMPGRRTFELAGRWGGDHHDGVPIHVLTHHTEDGDVPPGNTAFRTDVASWAAAARGRPVMVHGAAAAQALIAAGELDEMELHLVPVLPGAGGPIRARHFASGGTGTGQTTGRTRRHAPDVGGAQWEHARRLASRTSNGARLRDSRSSRDAPLSRIRVMPSTGAVRARKRMGQGDVPYPGRPGRTASWSQSCVSTVWSSESELPRSPHHGPAARRGRRRSMPPW